MLQPVPASGLCGKFSIWQCHHRGECSFALHGKLNYPKRPQRFLKSVSYILKLGRPLQDFKMSLISKVSVKFYMAAPCCVHLEDIAVFKIMHLWQEWKSCHPLFVTCSTGKEFVGDDDIAKPCSCRDT